MQSLNFFLDGEPVPQARARMRRFRSVVQLYDPCSVEKKNIAKKIIHQLKEQDSEFESKKSGAFKMILSFYCTPPKRTSEADLNLMEWGCIYKDTRPDIDNFAKFYCDACNGILYNDDGQIISLVANKYFSENPRTEIELIPMLHSEKIEKMLRETPKGAIFEFLEDVKKLEYIFAKISSSPLKGTEKEEAYRNDLVYILSRIGYSHQKLLKSMIKHSELWKECEEFNMYDTSEREGKTLC